MFVQKSKYDAQVVVATDQQALLDAIYQAQAIIEFTPMGEVVSANDLFLTTMGFSEKEIVGKHHRLFLDANDPAVMENYEQFWLSLASGQRHQGVFKRRTQQGKAVYLQATYSPVKSQDGRVVKVVKFAYDVTEQVLQEQGYKAQLDAIRLSMAVIEFDMQGQVVTANANFLATMGYALNEIVGKHHRQFVPTQLVNSAVYSQFWDELRQGKSQSGTFERVNKQGQSVWLEASYTVIFDADSKPTKVIKFASDITVSENNKRVLQAAVMEASRVLSAMQAGDLTQQMQGMFHGDLARLQDNINQLVAKLRASFCVVAQESREVAQSSAQVSDGNMGLSNAIQQQATAIEETAAALEELNAQVNHASSQAAASTTLAKQTAIRVVQSATAMQDAIQSMRDISDASAKITGIVGIIDSIAFQTNLLALNAAVEAARAGEHGRGFAVVAAEVRALAGKSAEAAKDIKGLIVHTAERITTGTQQVEQTGSMLSAVVLDVQNIEKEIAFIAENAQQQALGLTQIHEAVNLIDTGLQQSSALVEESASLSHYLGDVATELNDTVAKFNLGDCRAAVQVLDAHLPSVLVVEDNISNQKVAAAILRKLGIQSDVANNGQEAVDKASKQRYDMILMDIEMPVMDGFTATKKLRAMGIQSPIIALTGRTKRDKDVAINAGMNEFMTKPLEPQLLAQMVKRYI